jgi:16S rRNA (cytidine1402-2'-O)-methyltransferase
VTRRGASRPADPPGPTAALERGTLYVVATPIGNLGDVTLRALDVLRTVPLVAAEDTRHTRRLWARHGITTHLVSYHARNAATRTRELIAHLAGGNDLALVTDAGTPLVSDPGEALVAAWAGEGGKVVPIPGPSAVLAALVASGIPAPRWGFEGFLPRSGRERRERLARIAADDRAVVLFESPNRAAATLRDLADACGPDRAAALSRELTKLHEETWRGPLGELAARAAEDAPRGEVTMVVAGRAAGRVGGPGMAGQGSGTGGAGGGRPVLAGGAGESSAGLEGADPHREGADPRLEGAGDAVTGEAVSAGLPEARRRVEALVAGGLTRSAAARQVAAESGLPRREVFRP